MAVVDWGHKGKRLGARGEGEKVSRTIVGIGTVWMWCHNDAGLLMLFYAAKKYGEPIVGVYMVMVCRWTDHIIVRSAS
jgi:hypothetical protein